MDIEIARHIKTCPICKLKCLDELNGALCEGVSEMQVYKVFLASTSITMTQLYAHKTKLPLLVSDNLLSIIITKWQAYQADNSFEVTSLEKQIAEKAISMKETKDLVASVIWEEAIPVALNRLIELVANQTIKAIDLSRIVELLIRCGISISPETSQQTLADIRKTKFPSGSSAISMDTTLSNLINLNERIQSAGS
jgi:hypothetical protein